MKKVTKKLLFKDLEREKQCHTADERGCIQIERMKFHTENIDSLTVPFLILTRAATQVEESDRILYISYEILRNLTRKS